jgi:hypothetical protein
MPSRRWSTLGQCRLVAGEIWDAPANMLRRAPSRWLRQPNEILYVLLALDGPPLAREPLEGLAATALADGLFRARGSTTARLQRAIGAANRVLYEENKSAFPQNRCYGGVACVLFQSERAYIAQVGSPRTYHCQAGEVQGYTSQETGALLGQRERLLVHFSDFPLATESRILLTDDQWGGQPLRDALAQVDAEAAWASVVDLAPADDSSAWLIGPEPEVHGKHAPGEGIPDRARQVMSAARPVARGSRHSRVARGLWRWLGQAAREIAEGVLPTPPSTPPGGPGQQAKARPNALLQPYMPLIALGIPLLALLLTGLVYWQTQVKGSTEYAEYLSQAQAALSIAVEPETDRDSARVYLQGALAQVDAALALRPGQEGALTLRRQAQERLDVLNRATRLTFVRVLYEYPPESQPSRVLQVQADIYVLDRHTNQVYHHRLNESGQALVEDSAVVLLQQGQEVAGKIVGALADMVWLSSESGDQLLVLDQEGTLWAHIPGSAVQPLGLAGLGASTGVTLRISSYKGRLYVLVPHQGQVLRYPSAGNTFGPPEAYFAPGSEVDGNAISDMAIDGYIYLLWKQGLVRRFLGGVEQPLSISSLPDAPPGETPALFARPDEETAYLYVADTTQARVIQLTKEGEFVRQLKAQDPDLLTALRGLYVDEAQGRLWLTEGRRLLLAEVPPLAVSQ